MIRSRGMQVSAVLTVLLIGAAGVTYTAMTASAEPLGQGDSSRLAGAWARPDSDRLRHLRDRVVPGDHHFDNSADSVAGQASAYQKAVLADGNLTFDEYRQASLDWVACVTGAGIAVPGLRLDGLGRYRNHEFVFQGDEAAQAGIAAIKMCSAEYTEAVDFVWARATAPLSQEVGLASRAATGACFAASGQKEATRRPWSSEDSDVREAFFRCAREVQSELDIIVSFGMDGDGIPARR